MGFCSGFDILALIAVLSAAGFAPTDQPPAAKDQAPKKCEVGAVRGILYYEVDNDPEAARHRLDVYRPTGKGPFPVLLFVHGGAWMFMSKDDVWGIYGYGTIARCLAERGLVVVLPNYRLSPGVRHPEHIKDVARAFSWTCRNVAQHGGDPKQIFVGGHSAGGHLAALLATDQTYLKEVGREPKDIRGVIGVSGVYRVDDFDLKLSVADPFGGVNINVTIRPLTLVFGSDPEEARQASPMTHVRPGLPPLLLLTAGCDYPPIRRMAKEFSAALKKNGGDVEEHEVPWRTHETLIFDIARLSLDATTRDVIVKFIARHTAKPQR